MESGKLMLIGVVLLILGFVVPFLMLLQVIPSTFFLNFFAYGASTVGLILGFLGIALYIRHRPK